MTEQQFCIAEIEVAKSLSDEKIVGLFRFDGSHKNHRKGPTLIIMAEISSPQYVYERLLDVINETAEQATYLLSHVEQDALARFEKLVQRLNEAVATFLSGEPNPVSWNRVNIFVLELSRGHVCLTGRGRLMNLFLQKQSNGTYRTFDLLGSLDQPAEVDPQKPFPSIICGDVNVEDILVLGTTNFERIRNELQIKERVIELPPVTAALEIRQDLERRGTPDDFVAAVIRCYELEQTAVVQTPPTPEPEHGKSTESIKKFETVSEETTEQLSPPVMRPLPDARATVHAWKTRIASSVTSFIYRTRKRWSSDRLKDVAALTRLRGMNAGHGSIFTKKHKQTILVVLLGFIVIVGGITFWRYRTRVATAHTIWLAQFQEAQDNRNRAESDLIYANDSRAQSEVNRAEELLTHLDANAATSDDLSKLNAFKKDLAVLHERLRKVTNVNDVSELLTQETGLAAPMITKDAAYVVNNLTHEIIKIDLATKNQKRIKLPTDTGNITTASRGKQGIFYLTDSKQTVWFNETSQTVRIGKNLSDAGHATDLILYAGRAYILNGSEGKIVRASINGTDIGAGTNYLKATDRSISGAIAIAIDSNVYALFPDGTVARFLSGAEEDFTLAAIDPALHQAAGIWTSSDANEIVISDPSQKRIVLFNKDGSLKTQLASPAFQQPGEMDGDATSRRLLAIDHDRLLLIPMP